jgi:conjugative transfer region protein TrbK
MTRLTPFAASFVAVLLAAGCDRTPAAQAPKEMSAPQLKTELERCKELGLKAYDDAGCKQAQQESNDRFLGKSKEPAP